MIKREEEEEDKEIHMMMIKENMVGKEKQIKIVNEMENVREYGILWYTVMESITMIRNEEEMKKERLNEELLEMKLKEIMKEDDRLLTEKERDDEYDEVLQQELMGE